MDMVVSRIRVLQDNFIETLPKNPGDFLLGSGIGLGPSVGSGVDGGVKGKNMFPETVESDVESNLMDKIYDTVSADKSELINGDNVGKTISTVAAISNEIDELPVLTLTTINHIDINVPSSSYSDAGDRSKSKKEKEIGAPPVTVVDDLLKVKAFAAAVRALSRTASSMSSIYTTSGNYYSSSLYSLIFARYFLLSLILSLTLFLCLSLFVSLSLLLSLFLCHSLSLSLCHSLSTSSPSLSLSLSLLLSLSFSLSVSLPLSIYASSAVPAVGLDCEWRPTAYGTGTSDSNILGGSEDHPVATLQLAFRDEIFIIDMLSLSGTVTNRDIENGSDVINESDKTRILNDEEKMHFTSSSSSFSLSEERHTHSLTEAEGILCAALGELFAHQKIAILGL